MSKIEITLLADSDGAASAVERLERKVEELSKSNQQMARESSRAAKFVEGSYAQLQAELKENEKALKGMRVGSEEFVAQKAKVDELRNSLENANQSIEASAGRVSGIFSSGLGKLAQLAAGMASFQLVATAVVEELEKAKQLRIDAGRTTQTFEQAIADIGLNVGAEALPETRRVIEQTSQELGVDQTGLANVIGVAISAGASDLAEAVDVSAAAMKLTAGDTQKAVALVGGALDVASLAQSKNFEGALGQIAQVQSQVRSTDASQFAANIGGAIAAVTAKQSNVESLTTERGFELASVISQILKDQTGANTATALRDLTTKVDAFQAVKSDTVSADVAAQFNQAGTLDARIAVIRSDEALQAQFLGKLENSLSKIAIKEIVQGSDRAKEFDAKASATITGIDQATGQFQGLAVAIAAETANVRAARQAEVNIAASQISSPRGVEGTVVEIVEKTLDKVNLSGLDMLARKGLNAEFEASVAAGQSVEVAAVNTLEAAKQQVTIPTPIGTMIPMGRQVSEQDKRLIDVQIEAIRRLLLESQRQRPDRAGDDTDRRLLQQNTEATQSLTSELRLMRESRPQPQRSIPPQEPPVRRPLPQTQQP